MNRFSIKILKRFFLCSFSCVLFLSFNACSSAKKKDFPKDLDNENSELSEEESELLEDEGTFGEDIYLEEQDEGEEALSEDIEEESGKETESANLEEESLMSDEEDLDDQNLTQASETTENISDLTSDLSNDPTNDLSLTEETLDVPDMGDSISDLSEGETKPKTSFKKRSWVPVKKIVTYPFRKSGFLINAVYIVRPGDTLEGISQKIFQSDKTEELLQMNSHFRRKKIKVGNKLYYNSPQRPLDNNNLLVFYQDQGFPSESYISSKKENIRDISQNLLGDKDSWKEIWAINQDVKSKWMIPSGTKLVYWRSDLDVEASHSAGSISNPDNESSGFDSSVSEQKAMDNEPSPAEHQRSQNEVSASSPNNPEEMRDSSHSQTSASSMKAPEKSFHPPRPLPMNEDQKFGLRKSLQKQNWLTYITSQDNKTLLLGAGVFILCLIFLASLLKKRKQTKIIDF